MNKDKKKKDEWIHLASKSRPGRFYLFNKASGETKWISSNEGTNAMKQDSPPKLLINKGSKTPAQDRLKRLQHTLKACQNKVTTRQSSVQKAKTSTQQENELKDEPSTSTKARHLAKSPKKSTKRHNSDISLDETDNAAKRLKSSIAVNDKESNVKDPSLDSPSSSAFSDHRSIETTTDSSHTATASNTINLLNIEESKGSFFGNLRSGIVNKIKEICKKSFNAYKKDEKSVKKDNNVSNIIKTTKFKPASKTNVKQSLSSTPAKEEVIINQIKEEKLKSPDNKEFFRNLLLSTTKNCSIPSYPKGSANSRLERLKQSLLSQQPSCSTANNAIITNNMVSNVPTESTNNMITSESTTSKNYSISNASSTLSGAVEAMDWQPIVKEEATIQKAISENTFVVEKSNKLLLYKTSNNENQTIGDIIDAVNENLLRLSAEKPKDSVNSNKKWRTDFYYFIADTNVLLADLTFMEDLTKMQLCDTKGSMLYIPYSVLQELDKLKMRSGLQEGAKTRAIHAIKYLNSKFQNRSQHIQAQSALDERHHLIDINSADDSIMNCCLQVKQHVQNLLLLTEDVNLRNKAICNSIMVSTKSDLLGKRYDSSGIS